MGMSIKYENSFSGPRWVNLEGILREICTNLEIFIKFNRIEKKLLYKKVHFTIYPKDQITLVHFVEQMWSYNK